MTHKIKTLLIFSACATVLSMYTAAAAPCVSGDTLAQYEALGATGCTYGGLTFYDFGYATSNSAGYNGSAVAAGEITVNEVTNSTGSGFAFDSDWNSGTPNPGSEFLDGDITFDVSTGTGGPATIEDAGLSQTSGVLGNGSATVTETIGSSNTLETFEFGNNYNATTCAGIGGTWEASNSTCSLLAVQTTFTPTGSVSVSKDIDVASGSTGNATISLVQDTFSVVPEPRALSLLLGFGLLAGLVIRKKFQSVKA